MSVGKHTRRKGVTAEGWGRCRWYGGPCSVGLFVETVLIGLSHAAITYKFIAHKNCWFFYNQLTHLISIYTKIKSIWSWDYPLQYFSATFFYFSNFNKFHFRLISWLTGEVKGAKMPLPGSIIILQIYAVWNSYIGGSHRLVLKLVGFFFSFFSQKIATHKLFVVNV